ncbi:MurR/RpiR family transcriptional regulator HpxU [soil metagenome]
MGLTAAAPIGQRIDESYGDLSPQEQRAADFILDHLADLAVYNASELARLSGVSKATVSRLFRSLGFTDAQEVRNHARALRSQGVPIGGISLGGASPAGTSGRGIPRGGAAQGDVPSGEPAAGDGPAEGDTLSAVTRTSAALAAHVEQELSNIRTAMLAVTDGRLASAATLIAGARRVVVIGLRNSYPVALHLRQQLVQGLEDVRLAPQPAQSIGEELAGLGPRDVVVVVGFRRRPSGFTGVVDAVRHRNVPLVLIADSSAARFADHVTVWLDCPVDGVSALDSYAAANSLVALLASETLGVAARGSRSRISSINRLYGDLQELEPTI